MVQIRWTDQSLEDFESIAEDLNRNADSKSSSEVKNLVSSIEKLGTKKAVDRIVPEVGVNTIREMIIGNFRIICRIVSQGEIDILTIHKSSKMLDSMG